MDYWIAYRNTYSFNIGTTLGSIFASLLALIPGWGVPMSIVAVVLGVANVSGAVIDHYASLASHYGRANYYRYVLISPSTSPYYACSRIYYYDGLYDATTGNYQLTQTNVSTSPSDSVFNRT